MTLTEVTDMYYSIILYKKEGYDCFKYKFKSPHGYSKALVRFYEKNKFVLQEIAVYEKSSVVLRILINVFIHSKNVALHIPDYEYELFKNSLFEYKNEFSLFLMNHKVKSPIEVFHLFLKKKIPFYVFYYVIRFVRFETPFTDSELLKNKFKEIHLLMRFFKHFNEDEIKEMLKDLQKEIELNKI